MIRARTLISIAVALALVLALMPTVALAAEEGQSTGSFQAGNVDPTVTAVELWTTGGTPVSTTAMDPQVEYNVKVTVSDANNLSDLATVDVTIFYDADGTYAAGEETGATGSQTRVILTWTNGGGPPPWTIDPVTSATNSWTIESASCVEPTLTTTPGTFEFHFKPGKVATETVGAAKWHIYAEADDGEGGTPGSETLENLAMNWYGGVTVTTGTVDWGVVSPGMDFAEGDPSEEGSISVTYIANGAYDEQVAASSSWSGAPSGTATLNEDGTPGENEFSLKADDTGTLPAVGLVKDKDTTGYITVDDSNDTLTSESGDVTTNTLWLKLGTPFTGATYTGTIWYKILDGS